MLLAVVGCWLVSVVDVGCLFGRGLMLLDVIVCCWFLLVVVGVWRLRVVLGCYPLFCVVLGSSWLFLVGSGCYGVYWLFLVVDGVIGCW